MPIGAINGFIMQDGSGNYYAITPELLAQAKLTEEQKSALEERLQQASVEEYTLTPTGEARGYLMSLFGDGSVRFIGGIADGTSNTIMFGETTSSSGQGNSQGHGKGGSDNGQGHGHGHGHG